MQSKRIHFIGICGVAMSALAIAFKKNGWEVTGSDVGFYPPISIHLKKNGINYYPGWHPNFVLRATPGKSAPDIVVVGNVAGSVNPEFTFARENKLNCKSYPEVVAEFIAQKNSIVCAGTYGKTSSAALLTWILINAGMDPSYMFGGLSLNLFESAKLKNGYANYSVLEGDEYKTSRWDNGAKFFHYSPTHLLLTSISWDHADVYPTEDSYFEAFKKLIEMIPANGLIVACAGGQNVAKILESSGKKARLVTYGRNDADYVCENISQSKNGIRFIIKNNDREYKINSPVLGEHMAENICGAFAMAIEIGVAPDVISNSVSKFHGLKRRLEKRSSGKIEIYDDLAHSPAKARATLKTLREIYPDNKIFAIFEPNTGNRKIQSAPGYKDAFAMADEVIIPALTHIKTDLENPEKILEGSELSKIISHDHQSVKYISDDDELIDYVKKVARQGDVVVFLGSHGFRGMIERLSA